MGDAAYAMPERVNRGGLLARGVVLLASGSAVATLAAPARAAAPPDVDLAYLRVLIGAELLKSDFHQKAIASKRLAAKPARLIRQLLADDKAHYSGLAGLLNAVGQVPATSDDIDFSYPHGSFASQASIVKLGHALATTALGGYLGALENVQTSQFRLPIAQVAANEAQQAGAYAQLLGRPVVGSAFAASLQIDALSAVLDAYES